MRTALLIALLFVVQVRAVELSTAKEVRPLQARAEGVSWDHVLEQPAEWYAGAEATRIAENVLVYQRRTGGWPKNIDMARPLTTGELARIAAEKMRLDATIDNGATWRQMRYLARVFGATRDDRFRAGFFAGLEYLFAAEHTKGGWPQIYPLRQDYSRHITFNDGATVNVAMLLRDIATGSGFRFVDSPRRTRALQAVDRTIQMILAAQVHVDRRLTAWCAQHDAQTFEPRPARRYEPVALSGMESVEILRFLMSVAQPSGSIVTAIEQGVEWLRSVQLKGIRVEQVSAPGRTPPRDVKVVADPTAPPLWARFYEIGTNRPLFVGRDGIVKYSLAAIDHERRTGYSWLGPYAAQLLAKDYPSWAASLHR